MLAASLTGAFKKDGMWPLLTLFLLACPARATICDNTIYIYTRDDFMLIQSCPNSNFVLMNNISIVGPMSITSTFKGTFDGQGYHIGGIILSEQYDKAALFDVFSGSIRNVTLSTSLTLNNSAAKLFSGFAIEIMGAYFYSTTILSIISLENCIDGSIVGGALASTSETARGLSVTSKIMITNCECIVGGAIGQLDNNYTALRPAYWSETMTVNSDIKLSNSSSIVGGFVGQSLKNIRSLTLISAIEIVGNPKYPCIVGGVAGKVLGGFSSVFVYLSKMRISACEDSEKTIIAGITTNMTCPFPNCTVAENIGFYSSLIYTEAIPSAYVGGTFGILDQVSVSYSFIYLSHVETQSKFGGLAACINATTIDQVVVTITFITQIDNIQHTLYTGGMGGNISNYTSITNSYVKIQEVNLRYYPKKKTYFGGIGGVSSAVTVLNSYVAIKLVKLTVEVAEPHGSSFGGMFGIILYSPNDRAGITTSFVAIDEVIVIDSSTELFNVGGFVGAITGAPSSEQWFTLSNSWASIAFRITASRSAKECALAVGTLIGNPGAYNIVFSDIYIKVYYNLANIVKYKYNKDNNDKRYNGIGLITGLFDTSVQMTTDPSMILFKIICQVKVLYVENFTRRIHYIPGNPDCFRCTNIFITNTSVYLYYSRDTNKYLYSLADMQNINTYTEFSFGEDQIWQYDLDQHPYHTSLPFLLHHLDGSYTGDNPVSFIVPKCEHYMCWNYKNIWYGEPSIQNMDLQYQLNLCDVRSCILCYHYNRKRCIRCMAGYVLSTGEDVCLECNNECMHCLVPALEEACTSCSGYGSFVRNGQCVNEWYTCFVQNCLLCSFNDPRVCAVCAPGKGVQEESGICTLCTPPCKTCSTYNRCTSCNDYGLEALDGLCEYISADCLQACKFCRKDKPDLCLQCINESYILSEYKDCQLKPNPFCLADNCAVCSSTNNKFCNSCKKGYYLTGDRICKACEEACVSCTSYNICTECKDSSIKPYLGICNYSTKCTISNCKICTIVTEPNCMLCAAGYLLTENTCQKIVDKQEYYFLITKAVAVILSLTTFTLATAFPLVSYLKFWKEL